jgi:hypothetical protein
MDGKRLFVLLVEAPRAMSASHNNILQPSLVRMTITNVDDQHLTSWKCFVFDESVPRFCQQWLRRQHIAARNICERTKRAVIVHYPSK